MPCLNMRRDKKFFSKRGASKIGVYLLLIFCFISLSEAEEHWTRKHYLSIGLGVDLTQGDLDGKSSAISKSGSSREIVYAPNLATFFFPELELGANLNQHSIFLNGSYASPATNFAKKEPERTDETETATWRLGLGYRYNFFWPEPFQVFAGLSYSFMHLSTQDNCFFEKEGEISRGDATLMGNGFDVSAGMLYFIGNHLSMEMHLRFRTMAFTHVFTDNESGALDEFYWHFMEEMLVRISYHF